MKRKICLLLLVILLLSACGSKTTNANQNSTGKAENNYTVIDNRGKDSKTDAEITDNRSQNTHFTDDDFETNGYLYENSIGDSLYFLTIKNNSSASARISGNAIARDAEGNAVSTDDMSIDVIGPGEETIGYFYFDSVTNIETVEYNLSYANPSYYSVLSNLKVKQTINDSNITLEVTNNGTISAQFVEAYAIFFDKEDNAISYSNTYILDNDSEIKPGVTLSAQLDYSNDFDHVIVFLAGRSDGTSHENTSPVKDADFDIQEFAYEDSIGDTLYFLIIANNSDMDVEVSGNATAKDAAGSALGADEMSIDVIGPGQQSIGYFYFDNVAGVDHVEYRLSYNTDLSYKDVLCNLAVEETINNENIIVSVKNTGDYSARFVEAYALFFDAKGRIISYNSTYFTDDDSEIKPDATITKQLNSYTAFDSVQLYFTGRASK